MKRTLSLLIFLYSFSIAQNIKNADFRPFFQKYDVNGCFAFYDESKDTYIKYNPSRCDSAYLPASTFKIPNSLVALEEGIIKDTFQIVAWDETNWPVSTWNRDQTLGSAIRYSCVWFYMKVVDKIGIKTYTKYLNAFDYGNKETGNPVNRFWLEGDIRISANQQIEFLRKFYHNKLPISKQSIDIVKNLLVLERGNGYTFSAKTGGTMIDDHQNIMWLVGYVESGKNVLFFALNFTTDDFERTRQARFEIVKGILKQLEVLN
jgi:beta-lactamase class D